MNFRSLGMTMVILFLVSISLYSQKNKVKFGSIDESYLSMSSYELDPEAEAVKLYDKGWLHFEYSDEYGFRMHLDRHMRIKVLTAAGTDAANFTFSLYRRPNGKGEEELKGIKGYTYNLVNGKEVQTKLEKEHIFIEKESKTRTTYKIVMPQVKEGAVIELKYTRISDFLGNIPTWYFESYYPTMHSEYVFDSPEYLLYRPNMQGFHFDKITVNKSEERTGKIMSYGINYRMDRKRWVLKDIPGFSVEPYTSSPLNFLTRVDFELTGTNFPGSFNKDYSQSWASIHNLIMNDEDFGGQLNKGRQVAHLLPEMVGDATEAKDKIVGIYEGVKKKVKWNEAYGYWPQTNIRKTLDQGKGNSASVNMVLLNLFKAASLQAHPVLVSTRSHGYINTGRPSIDQFNHMIVAVETAPEKWVLLDATDRTIPYPMLPQRDLNLQGRVFTPGGSDWINIAALGKEKRAAQLNLEMDEEGVLTGSLKIRDEGYAARDFRIKYAKAGDEASYWKEWAEKHPNITIVEKKMEGVDDIYSKVNCELTIECKEFATKVDDFIYLSPILLWQTDENPFKLEKREYPVDLPYAQNVLYSMELRVPETYAIEEMPEKLNVSLPNNAGKYTYSVSSNGNTIRVLFKFNLAQHLFVGEEYAGLRQFFDMVVDKESAQIVLRKKT